MSVKLITWNDSLVTPLDDALVYHTAIENSGIIYGSTVSIKSSNLLHITSGHGILCGRKFTVKEEDIPVVLPATGDMNGRLYIHMDLSNTGEPIQLMTEIAQTLTPEIREDDVNINLGVYEMNVCTFRAAPEGISSLQMVAEKAFTSGEYAKKIIAPIETGSTFSRAYKAGESFIYNNKIYRASVDIGQGEDIAYNILANARETIVSRYLSELDEAAQYFMVSIDHLNARVFGGYKAIDGVASNPITAGEFFINETSFINYHYFSFMLRYRIRELWLATSNIQTGSAITDGANAKKFNNAPMIYKYLLDEIKSRTDPMPPESELLNIGTYSAGAQWYIFRYGKMRIINVRPVRNLTIGSLITVGTLAAKDVPIGDLYQSFSDASQYNVFRVRLLTNGQIGITAYHNAAGNIAGQICYFVN